MADPYDADLDWWFNCADALMGEKSNLSSTISALERGGGNVGAYEDTTYDRVSNLSRDSWLFGRERKLRARFLTLPKSDQRVLVAYYGTGGLKQPHMWARFGRYSQVIQYMAHLAGLDLMFTKAKDIKVFEAESKAAVLGAHKGWRATKPKKVKDVLKDFEIPLPAVA